MDAWGGKSHEAGCPHVGIECTAPRSDSHLVDIGGVEGGDRQAKA